MKLPQRLSLLVIVSGIKFAIYLHQFCKVQSVATRGLRDTCVDTLSLQ